MKKTNCESFILKHTNDGRQRGSNGVFRVVRSVRNPPTATDEFFIQTLDSRTR